MTSSALSSDPASILLAHDQWATGQIIERCRALTGEQFHQSFDMGLGSLHGTIAHILSAMRGWGDLLADRPQRARLEDDGPFTLDRLSTLLGEIADDFAAHAPPAMDPAEVVSGERGGKTWSFTRGAVLTHVTTHGMHHRAQCVNMLRRLGDEGPWKASVVAWVLTEESR